MKLVILEAVEVHDLTAIYDYIAEENPIAAYQLLTELQQKFNYLCQHPYAGRLRSELRDDLRSLTYGNFVILYRVLGDCIEIVYVIHGRRDIATVIEQETR